MSGLTTLIRCRTILTSNKNNIIFVRMMGGHPSKTGPPPNLTGGQFVEPLNDPKYPTPSHDEITEWVRNHQPKDQWTSLGWDNFDPENDRFLNNFHFFTCVTLFFVGLTFIIAYSPFHVKKDWHTREAYLLLREREAAGVEPISREFIDPVKVLASLPSDEELKEAGVVINI
eukprot:TRINITY_DN412_c0_g1_i3.p1 TRINITY_DN412_c0_g1~~TRINITY_DN412_c0_g1_i3.p1  ORF type:complete len:179 (-),score=33.98 TRINITY_DN412_c0_g1_i3:225-740(-)